MIDTTEFDKQNSNDKQQKISKMDNEKLLHLYDNYMRNFEQLYDDETKMYESYSMIRKEISERMAEK